MLSRVANSLFWLARYVERAENTARFLAFHGYASPLETQESFRTLSLDTPSATRDVLLSAHDFR